jgi:hypothetical protein
MLCERTSVNGSDFMIIITYNFHNLRESMLPK